MLTTSVIIVLREVIEAVLVISLLLGLSRHQKLSMHWLFGGALAGILFSWLYARQLGNISEWFDGVGQEVFVGGVLVLVYWMLLVVSLSVSISSRYPVKRLLQLCMTLVMALILSHEMAELLVYWQGMLGQPEYVAAVISGSVIGMGIGFSTGALFYFLVVSRLASKTTFSLQLLLGLVAAGLVLQATQFFIQADWLPAGAPLWDLSVWIPESSVVGQLLYALFGYEATPAPVQVVAYSLSLALIWGAPFLALRRFGLSNE